MCYILFRSLAGIIVLAFETCANGQHLTAATTAICYSYNYDCTNMPQQKVRALPTAINCDMYQFATAYFIATSGLFIWYQVVVYVRIKILWLRSCFCTERVLSRMPKLPLLAGMSLSRRLLPLTERNLCPV